MPNMGNRQKSKTRTQL